jgi:hypothetical protein
MEAGPVAGGAPKTEDKDRQMRVQGMGTCMLGSCFERAPSTWRMRQGPITRAIITGRPWGERKNTTAIRAN